MPKDAELLDLVDEEVGSICFVRDYVEVHFDGPIFRCLAPPTLDIEGRRLVFPGDGSRDALCRLIGRTVQGTRDEPERLVVDFGDGTVLSVPKYSEDAHAEIAHLIGVDDEGKLYGPGMLIWENLRPTRDDLNS